MSNLITRIPEVRDVLKKFGRISGSGPNPPPDEVKKIVIGLQHAHGRAQGVQELIDKRTHGAHLRHQKTIRAVANSIARVFGPNNTHFILENSPRYFSHWVGSARKIATDAVEFAETGMSALDNDSNLKGYYDKIAQIVKESNRLFAEGVGKLANAMNVRQEAETMMNNVDGSCHIVGQCFRDGNTHVLHGHDSIGVQFEQEGSSLQRLYRSTKVPEERLKIRKQVGELTARYYNHSHQGIAKVIEEDVPDGSAVVVFQGGEHFVSGVNEINHPECDGTHLEHHLMRLRNSWFGVLWSKEMQDIIGVPDSEWASD